MSDVAVVADRYEVGPVLGHGGMAEVRQAHDQRLHRDVAIKFLRPDLAAQPSVRRRFAEEARNAARLTHPNVVLVLDTGEHDGQPYLVMECLPGRTMRDELASGPMSEARARVIAEEVLSGLAAAHEAGVIHRDVSPANILLTDDGHAKLADFGIAKSAEGLPETMVGQVLGTPSYLSPERLQGAPATASDDIYAVGVVLYEALTGERLFQGANPVATAQAVINTRPEALRDRRPDLTPGFAAAIDRAMARDHARRTASATEMRAQLDQPIIPIASEATVAIPVVTTTMPVMPLTEPALGWRAWPRHVWLMIAVAAAFVVVLLAATHGSPGGDNVVANQPATSLSTPAPTTLTTLPPVTQARVVTAVVQRPQPAPKAKHGHGNHDG